MRRPLLLATIVSVLSLAVLSAAVKPVHVASADGVQITTDEHGATIKVNGKLFTRYLIDAGPKPYCWPVVGPTGAEVTRDHPMREIDGEKHDHPHQRSWWFTHGNVNGIDFWAETDKSGRIIHRDFVAAESGSDVGVLTTRNDWLGPNGKKVCEDVRTLRVYNVEGARLVDFDITVKATEGPVTFGDTKEGMMGVRVATSMDVNSKQGGRIENSRGETGRVTDSGSVVNDAWGKPAEWVDYTGPVEGETLGITIMNHPTSFRFPTYWHVRQYGLFAANPFGLHDFKGDATLDGSHTIPKGESITFRYRIYIHQGDAEQAKVAERYREYVQSR
jgi:hypothetical protein